MKKKPSYTDLENRIRDLEQRLAVEVSLKGVDAPQDPSPEPAHAPLFGDRVSETAVEVSDPGIVEESLKKNEQFLPAVFDAIQEGITVLSPDLEIVRVNQSMKNRFRNVVPLEGKKCYRIFQGRETPCEGCPTVRAMRSGNLEMEEIPGKNSEVLELFAFPMFDEAGRVVGVVELVRDVTARKRAEKDKGKMQTRLLEAQSMQAIATLAGGIAHQFNNALASISLSLDLIRMDVHEDDPLLGHIRKMKASTDRMTQLTSQLLAYAEGGRYQTKIISMHDFVREALPSVTHDLYPSVHVDTDLPPDTLCVKADVTQMQMVLSAVIHNAAEAMDEGGWIRVRTRNENVPDGSADTPLDLAPGPYVCLTVEDNGKGMDRETRKRIFEPFFTTKFHGRGLGLPAVYGIIKGHHGCVLVDSEPGKGTTVRIYLPAVESDERRPEIREGEPLKGAGTVLLIDDEEMIMDVSRELLERIGYRVLTASTGKEAVETSSSFQGKIDLAILDVMLPDMGGREIYQRLVKERPDLKVLVCSGYSADGPAQEILKAGAQGFIQKPFSLVELNRQLKEILKRA